MTDKKRLDLKLTANESLTKDLRTALSVPPGVLAKVAEFVNTDEGIEIPETETLLGIWKESRLTSNELSDTYSVLRHFFQQAVKRDIETDVLMEELRDFCSERDIPGFVEREAGLRAFLTPKPAYLKRRRFADFAFGVVPALYAINGVVQLRTAFQDKDSTEISGYVPVVQVRLRAEHTDTDEQEVFVFQVDEPGLAKLLKYLRSYQQQLEAVKKATEGSLEIYTRPQKEESQ